MSFHPYLFFSGNCAEAFAFYADVFGTQAQVMTNADLPPGTETAPGAEPHHVMHASLVLGGSMLMGSDDPSGDDGPKTGFSVAFTAADPDAVARTVDALADGGELTLPVEATFWAPAFGMVVDRFGVSWMVDCYPADDAS